MKCLLFAILLGAGLGAHCQYFSIDVESNSPNKYQLIPLIADRNYSSPAIDLGEITSTKKHHSIPLNRMQFALLKSEGKEYRLLIAPRESLQIKLKNGIQFSGSLRQVNELIQQLNFDEIPFYQKTHGKENKYTSFSFSKLYDSVLKVERDSLQLKKKRIESTSIPAAYKSILYNELEYLSQCYLYDLGRMDLTNAGNTATDSFLIEVMKWKPVPTGKELAISVYGGMITDFRIQYSVNSIAKSNRKDPVVMKQKLADSLGLSFDSINSLVKEYGERYIVSWLFARKHFDADVAEKVLFNKIIDAYNDNWYKSVRFLSTEFKKSYPKSVYTASIEQLNASVLEKYKLGQSNTKIHFINADKDSSLAAVLEKYKGSYVYLDFWGTWCGPCRMEIPFAKEVKNRYKATDLKFVYFDLDEADKNDLWKEFVQYNEMEGDHYRFDRTKMEKFWKPLEALGGRINLYPTYVLIDPNGQIITPNAPRPSDKEKLFTLLDPLILKK